MCSCQLNLYASYYTQLTLQAYQHTHVVAHLMQVRVRQPALLSLFSRHADSKGKQAKLKSPSQLQELLDICRSLLQVGLGFWWSTFGIQGWPGARWF